MTDRLLSRGVTHRGTVRTRNEDAFVDRGDIGLWAVADGAGGHGAGDVASAAVATGSRHARHGPTCRRQSSDLSG